MKRPKPVQGFKKFVSKRQPAIKDVIKEPKAGGVVYRKNPRSNKTEILLIQDAKNRWSIPKGSIEEGESAKQTAAREINEETGLKKVRVRDWLGKINFQYRRQQSLILVTTEIFLVEAQGDTDKIVPEEWMNGIKWFEANEALEKIEYEGISKLVLISLKKIRTAGA